MKCRLDWPSGQTGRQQMTNLLFSFQGRINRAKFWLVHLGIFVVEAIVLSLMGGTAAIISGDYEQVIIVSGGATGVVWTIVGVGAFWGLRGVRVTGGATHT